MKWVKLSGRILSAPIVFFVWAMGGIILGSIPFTMGIGQIVYLSLKPIKGRSPKEVKEEIRQCAIVAFLPIWGPFLITYNWTIYGDMGIE